MRGARGLGALLVARHKDASTRCGCSQGAVLVLAGTSLAAVAAFSISRGIGRQLAERLVKHEGLSSLSSDDGDGGGTAGGTAGAIQRQLARVEAAIESGGFKQQALAIFLLRLTPAPFRCGLAQAAAAEKGFRH